MNFVLGIGAGLLGIAAIWYVYKLTTKRPSSKENIDEIMKFYELIREFGLSSETVSDIYEDNKDPEKLIKLNNRLEKIVKEQLTQK